jgi:outer membrane murein-binding lipoprotein Lpp
MTKNIQTTEENSNLQNEAIQDNNPEEFKRTIISDQENDTSEYAEPVFTKKARRNPSEINGSYIALTLILAVFICAIAFITGFNIKSNSADAIYDKLILEDSEYNQLIEAVNDINAEIDSLTHDRDSKQAEYDALMSYNAKSDEIAEQIASLQNEISELQNSSAAKQEEITKLTGSIETKTSSIVMLSPGIYTVGDNIIAGKYNATGSGSVLISSAQGAVKLNTVLTADGTEVTLDDGDKIQLDTRAKFSPAQ